MAYSNIKVDLLYYTKDPARAVATAARLCYSKVGAADLVENMKEEQAKKILFTILESGHNSTLEHATYTFAIEGVSRALTHQLVRHRMASYNQQSQRYVKADKELDVIIPESIKNNNEAKEVFDSCIEACQEAYTKLNELDVPKEDARYLLPNACETKIVVTMNIRELLHFFSVRCCNRAQWEIRDLAKKMLELVRPTAPFIFMDAGPSCVRGKCKEGKMCCGHPWGHIDRSKLD